MTYGQIIFLYELAIKRKMDDMKFQIQLQGGEPSSDNELDPDVVKEKSKSNLLFGDPADYASMDEVEKKALSDKMLRKFKGMFG